MKSPFVQDTESETREKNGKKVKFCLVKMRNTRLEFSGLLTYATLEPTVMMQGVLPIE